MRENVVVLISGIPGWGASEEYWQIGSELKDHFTSVKLLYVKPCPLASHHDRACEIFGEVKGTIVDYGDSHSKGSGHARLGKNYVDNGLYSQWNQSNPVHIIAHSTGANTARMLQRLLADDFWKCGTASSWIASITFVNACFNICGLSKTIDKYMSCAEARNPLDMPPNVKPTPYMGCRRAAKALLRIIRWAAYERVKFSNAQIRDVLSWPVLHWQLKDSTDPPAYTDCISNLSASEEKRLLKKQMKDAINCGIFEGKDNIIYEHSTPGFKELNEYFEGSTETDPKPSLFYPQTFYLALFSCATDASQQLVPPEMSPILWPFAAEMLENEDDRDIPESCYQGFINLTGSEVPCSDSDGISTLVDQSIPLGCENFACVFPLEKAINCGNSIQPGTWYFDNIVRWVKELSFCGPSAVGDGSTNVEESIQSDKTERIWDHFDVCWARTFLKYANDARDPKGQQTLYANIFRYLDFISQFFIKA